VVDTFVKMLAPMGEIVEKKGSVQNMWVQVVFFRYDHPFSKIYATQTKILEGGTKDVMRIFERLFNGPLAKLSTHVLEKCFENPHYIFCSSFQNLRLGGIKLHQIVNQ